MQPRSVQSAPIVAPRSTTARSIVVSAPTRTPDSEHDAAADPRAGGDRAVALDQRGRDHAAAVLGAVLDAHEAVAHARATAVATVPSRMSNVPSR